MISKNILSFYSRLVLALTAILAWSEADAVQKGRKGGTSTRTKTGKLLPQAYYVIIRDKTVKQKIRDGCRLHGDRIQGHFCYCPANTFTFYRSTLFAIISVPVVCLKLSKNIQ